MLNKLGSIFYLSLLTKWQGLNRSCMLESELFEWWRSCDSHLSMLEKRPGPLLCIEIIWLWRTVMEVLYFAAHHTRWLPQYTFRVWLNLVISSQTGCPLSSVTCFHLSEKIDALDRSQTQHHPLDFKVLFPSELMSCVSRDELPPAETTSHLLVYSLADLINI